MNSSQESRSCFNRFISICIVHSNKTGGKRNAAEILNTAEKSQTVTDKFKNGWGKLLERHLGNPLNQYRLIRRFYRDWKYVKLIIEAIFEPFTVKHITEVIDDYEILKDDYDEELLHLTNDSKSMSH